MELSRAIHILCGGWAEQIQDLLTGWLQEALLRFPWIWPTVRKARTIPLLMGGGLKHLNVRIDSTIFLSG